MEYDFSLKLLQTISDWQYGGTQEYMKEKGGELKTLCGSLPEKFLTSGLVAFRKIDLGKQPVWDLFVDNSLQEKISSWTLNNAIASHFDGGVPGKGWQGLIVTCRPANETVIVNLHELFNDCDFQNAKDKYKYEIENFNDGMGYYKNNEAEIIIEKQSLVQEDIYAIGGISSNATVLARMFFDREPTEEDVEYIKKSIKKTDKIIGGNWLTGDPMKRALNRTIDQVPDIKKNMDYDL